MFKKLIVDVVQNCCSKLINCSKKFWGVPKGCGTPKLCQNICLLNIYCYQKNGALAGAVKKTEFLGPYFGGFLGKWPKNFSVDKNAFATQQLYAKI